MENLQRAKNLLTENNASIVLVKDDEVFISDKKGIAPMIGFISDNTNLNGFSAADKTVGKAAALLFAFAGIKEIYAEKLSRATIPVLEEHNIGYSYKEIYDRILNRDKSDICPMEKTVADINDPKEAFIALKAKLEMLGRSV